MCIISCCTVKSFALLICFGFHLQPFILFLWQCKGFQGVNTYASHCVILGRTSAAISFFLSFFFRFEGEKVSSWRGLSQIQCRSVWFGPHLSFRIMTHQEENPKKVSLAPFPGPRVRTWRAAVMLNLTFTPSRMLCYIIITFSLFFSLNHFTCSYAKWIIFIYIFSAACFLEAKS